MQAISLLAGGEPLNPLIPHTSEIIVGFIAFTLLFLVLKSKVVPMFEKAYAEPVSYTHLTLPTNREV